ncbi:YwaF family protein [Mycoplasmatota bacterium]|nr:YwaF family protein [Mycoplasmatota bacterium]
MEIINKILEFLNKQMTEPVAFSSFTESWFYYLSLLLVVLFTVFLASKFRKLDKKGIKKIILFVGILLVVFEIYKQLLFSYTNGWDYRWYAFPYQFCSTAMFAMMIAGLTKNDKVFDVMLSFLATFSLFAGAAVMFYPADVFVTSIGINIQTMVYHGSMVVVGVAIIFSGIVKTSIDTLLKAILPMTVFWMFAILLNGVVNNLYPTIGTFNMFLINPRYNSSIPILNLIQPIVSPPVFQLAYLLGISFASFVTFKLFVGIKHIGLVFKRQPSLAKNE